MRAGDLEEERVRLAAYLGDPAARLLLHDTPICTCGITRKKGPHTKRCSLHPARLEDTPHALRCPDKLSHWLRGFEQWGREAGVRAIVAAVNAGSSEPQPELEHEQGLVESWVLCPCPAHLEEVASIGGVSHRHDWRAYALDCLRDLIPLDWERGGPLIAGAAIAAGSLEKCAAALGPEGIAAAIRTELVPWAVGERDPIRDRSVSR